MGIDKFKYYDNLSRILEDAGYTVEQYKEINCGLQFNILGDSRKHLLRVYESKKGVRLDLSQVRDEQALKHLSACLESPASQGDDSNKPAAEDAQSGRYKVAPGGSKDSSAKDPVELVGTDESGKGDYFGPLVIAGVYVDAESSQWLKGLGVADSKKLSDTKISQLSASIKEKCPHSVVTIGNQKYNELYEKIGNLNKLLAWGHARAIENILAKVECKHVLSDQFGDPNLIKNALMDKGKNINLDQRHRAEENIAVAAASILARNEFVLRIEAMEKEYGQSFPKGASSSTVESAKNFVKRFGADELCKVAKTHFKTTESL